MLIKMKVGLRKRYHMGEDKKRGCRFGKCYGLKLNRRGPGLMTLKNGIRNGQKKLGERFLARVLRIMSSVTRSTKGTP